MAQTTEEKRSVQTFPDAKRAGGQGGPSPLETMLLSFYTELDQAPAYWSYARDAWLRSFVTDPGNDLLAGTMATVTAKVATTGWVLEGPERTANKYRNVLVQLSDFGAGWSGYVQKWVWDYLSQDAGGWSERIRMGKANKQGAAIGFANLDNARTRITGDPMLPVEYTPVSFDGKNADSVLMHHSQVMHLVDSPTPNALRRGVGFCAVSRAITTAQILLDIATYERERLSDLPPAGLLMLNNMTRKQWEDVEKQYETRQKQQGNRIWRDILTVFGMDPSLPIQAEILAFSGLPDNFDKQTATEIAIYSFALAFRIDPREIWPVSAGPMGTATEANIQHIKAKGKGAGLIMTEIERMFNQELSLPATLTFRFDFQDAEEDLQSAEIASAKAEFLRKLTEPIGQGEDGIISREEGRAWLVKEGLFDEEDLLAFGADESSTDVEEAKSAYAIDMGPKARVYSDGRVVRLEKRPQVWPGWRAKGGEGSGHFDHAGRPGEVGGSLPSGMGGTAPSEANEEGREKADKVLNHGLTELRASLGDESANEQNWRNADADTRSLVKDELVWALVEETGLDYDTVNALVEQWTLSSADEDLRSLSLQVQAAKVFGLEVRPSLLERIAKVQAERANAFDDDFDIEDFIDSDPELFTWEEHGVSVGQQTAFLEGMRDLTQESLRGAGYRPGDTVQLYRGMGFASDSRPSWSTGDTVSISGNPLQSWSVGRGIASSFSKANQFGAVLWMEVPIESIIGTARTGFGSLIEGEFVIMSSGLGHSATVFEIH